MADVSSAKEVSKNILNSAQDLGNDIWRGAVVSSIENPVTSIGQLFNKDFCFEPIQESKCEKGSAGYYASGIGQALGTIVDIVAIKSGLGKVASTNLASTLKLAPILENKYGMTATSGAIYGGFATPIEISNSDAQGKPLNTALPNQLFQRIDNAAISAGTFLALHKAFETADAWKPLETPTNKFQSALNFAAPKSLGILASAPIGVANTEVHSLTFEHQSASKEQMLQSAIDWTVIGGATGMIGAIGSGASKSEQSTTAKDASRSPSAPKFFRPWFSSETDPVLPTAPKFFRPWFSSGGTPETEPVLPQEQTAVHPLLPDDPSIPVGIRPSYEKMVTGKDESGKPVPDDLDGIDLTTLSWLSGKAAHSSSPQLEESISNIMSGLKQRGTVAPLMAQAIFDGASTTSAAAIRTALTTHLVDGTPVHDELSARESQMIEDLKDRSSSSLPPVVEALSKRGSFSSRAIQAILDEDVNARDIHDLSTALTGRDSMNNQISDYVTRGEMELLSDQSKKGTPLSDELKAKMKERGPVTTAVITAIEGGLSTSDADVLCHTLQGKNHADGKAGDFLQDHLYGGESESNMLLALKSVSPTTFSLALDALAKRGPVMSQTANLIRAGIDPHNVSDFLSAANPMDEHGRPKADRITTGEAYMFSDLKEQAPQYVDMTHQALEMRGPVAKLVTNALNDGLHPSYAHTIADLLSGKNRVGDPILDRLDEKQAMTIRELQEKSPSSLQPILERLDQNSHAAKVVADAVIAGMDPKQADNLSYLLTKTRSEPIGYSASPEPTAALDHLRKEHPEVLDEVMEELWVRRPLTYEVMNNYLDGMDKQLIPKLKEVLSGRDRFDQPVRNFNLDDANLLLNLQAIKSPTLEKVQAIYASRGEKTKFAVESILDGVNPRKVLSWQNIED